RLPIMYLLMGALVIGASFVHERWFAKLPRRGMLIGLCLFGAAGGAVLWLLAASKAVWLLGVIYVWTGALATVLLLQFWLLASEHFDVHDAKKSYARIAAGGVVGAVLGAALARGLLALLPTRHLILGSAVQLLVAAAVLLHSRGPESRVESLSREPTDSQPEAPEHVEDGYAWRVIGLVAVLTVAATFADFQFKSSIQQSLPKRELAPFLASFGLVVNLLALAFQLLLAPLLLRKVGVGRSLRVLPGALLVSGVGAMLLPGLGGSALLKGADGSLRHGLHQAATEILFLPLSDVERSRIKTWAAAFGRRAAQAFGSVVLLALISLANAELTARAACIVLSAFALWLSFGIQGRYVERFRIRIRTGTLWTAKEAPEPDRYALLMLVEALASQDSRESLAALRMLAQLQRTDLIPARVLADPRPPVVLEAVGLLRGDPRRSVRQAIRDLAEHRSPEVRAASLRHARATRFQTQIIEPHLTDAHAEVRAAARVLSLVRRAGRGSARACRALNRLSRDGSRPEKLALAARVAELRQSGEIAQQLARDTRREVRVALAEGLLQGPREEHLPALVQLLIDRKARPCAQRALVLLGETAQAALARTLASESVDSQIRLHIPRSLSRFPEASVTDLLLRLLTQETDEAVSYKLLRALGTVRNHHPEHSMDAELLETCIGRELAQLRQHRVAATRLTEFFGREPADDAAQLLLSLVLEKRDRALLRLSRALHIWDPTQQFESLYAGLTHDEPELRAASLEVLLNLLPGEWGDEIARYVDGEPEADSEGDRQSVLTELSSSAGVVGVFAREVVHRLHRLPLLGSEAAIRHPAPHGGLANVAE
ncbi:MAG: MFS transporter, partial [Polyangiaceae bacterium]